MFRKRSWIRWRQVVLAATLLVYPCGLIAQRGAGGGHVGGGTAGGGGLSGGGRATGIDAKDDLKDFHETLAVQATSQQITEYSSMVKRTESAGTELHAFLELAAKQNETSELATRNKVFEQVLELARTENTKFLEQLSEPQKSGLKETVKKLAKEDSELAEQARMLNGEILDPRASPQQISSSGQVLESTLTTFHEQQLGLGEEMSIGSGGSGQNVGFNIPPVKTLVHFENQDVTITTLGVISKTALQGDPNTFAVELTADMSDLQRNMTDILRAQLDKADPCGEQIAIQNAAVAPSTPASLVVVQLHYQRWACFGRGNANEMAEGNGTIEIILTPVVGPDGILRLSPAIGRVNAQGLVGESLRSGSLGEFIRDKTAQSLLSAVQQSSDYKTLLPRAAQGSVTLGQAHFEGTGLGKLSIVLDGEIRVISHQGTPLASELNAGERKGQAATVEVAPR